MKNVYIVFLFFILIFINTNIVYSQDEPLFGDFLIEVTPNGIVKITGDTNYKPYVKVENSQEYTSKDKDVWTLNISSNETFEYYIYEIRMPRGTEIVSMNDKSSAKIFSRDQLIVLGEGNKEPMDILVKYKIDYAGAYYIYPISGATLLIIIIITLTIFFIYKRRKNKNNKKQQTQELIKEHIKTEVKELVKEQAKKQVKKESIKRYKDKKDKKDKNINSQESNKEVKFKVDISIYPIRQQDILNILLKKGKISQKELEDTMEIPSSSISRNIQSLESRKIITKERIGHTNYISINEEVLDK